MQTTAHKPQHFMGPYLAGLLTGVLLFTACIRAVFMKPSAQLDTSTFVLFWICLIFAGFFSVGPYALFTLWQQRRRLAHCSVYAAGAVVTALLLLIPGWYVGSLQPGVQEVPTLQDEFSNFAGIAACSGAVAGLVCWWRLRRQVVNSQADR